MPESKKKVSQKPLKTKPSDVQESESQPKVTTRQELRAFLSQSFAGPLPPPEIFAGYEKVLKGAADRILKMAERQAEHRQSLEKQELESETGVISRGQWFAFIVTILVVIAGVSLMAIGKSPWGLALILTDLSLLAGIFLFDKYQAHKSMEDQDEVKI